MRKALVSMLIVMTLSLLARGFDVQYNRISSEQMKLDFNVDDFKIVEVIEGGVTYSKIDYNGSILTNDKGYAALPRFTASVQLKDDKNIDLKYSAENYVEYKLDYPLLPSRGVISRSQNPSEIPYEIAAKSIEDVWYPRQIAENIDPFIMRDVRGTTVIVHPFQYNSEKQILRVYKNLSISLTDNDEITSNPLVRRTKGVDSEMSGMYKSLFLNYNETKAMDIGEFGELLIVYTSENGGLTALNPYIQWKEEMGYTVNLLEVSNGTDLDVSGDIQTEYDANPNILYVQLVGDWANIKSKLDNSTTSTIGSQDPMLGCVVGTDQYMDIMVGRFSVQSSTDVATQINKAINYEKNPEIGGAWYDTALGMARVEGDGGGDDGEADDQHQEYIRDRLLSFNYSTVNREYDNNSAFVGYNATSATISTVINSGISILNYINHGDWTGWSVGDFDENDVIALTNGDKLPFVISVACLVGMTSWSGGDCFAETWLRKSGGGAVVGMFSSISQPWKPPMSGQDYFNDVLIGGYDYNSNSGSGINTNEQRTRFGAIACNATNLMLEENPTDASTRDTQEAWNIFGDVTLQVRTDQPILIDNSNTTLLPSNYTTTITASGSPVEGARVTLYQNGTNYTSLTDVNGDVSINHDFAIASDVTVTITGYNLETEQSVWMVTGDLGGTFAIDTTNLDYGTVSAGSNSVQQFVISNSHGSETITGDITTITGYFVTVAAKGDVDIKDIKNVMGYSVAPGTNKFFNLTFEPTTGGNFNGNITITSSDTNHATEYIAVTGTGIVPDININPVSLSATAAPGASDVKTFNIENTDLGTLDYSMSINYTGGKEIKASGADTYGYKWKDSDEVDGPAYLWEEINISGTALNLSDDGVSSALNLGFTFNFYGVDYTTVVVGANGAITFTGTAVGTTNATIPSSATPNALISPFWDDLRSAAGGGAGVIYSYADGANSRFIVEWDAVVDYGTTNANTFQIIIYDSGKIVFQYADMQGQLTNCTVGIEDHNGTDGCLVTYDAAYLKNNLAIQFQSTPEWLSLDNNMGSIVGVGSDTITATCDATELEVGVYTADIMIASNDADESTKILPITFTVTDTPAPPSAPTLASPTDASTIADTTPTFDWSDVSGADTYMILVDNNSNFSSLEIDQTVAVSDYTPGTALAYDTYYWKVLATNGEGSSAYSGTWTVIIEEPLLPPDITLSTATVNTTAAPEATDADSFDIGNTGEEDITYDITYEYTSKGKADITVESNDFESGLVYANSGAINFVVATGLTVNCANLPAKTNGATSLKDGVLTSAAFDGTGCTSLTLDFDQDFSTAGSSDIIVEYTIDGSSWNSIYTATASTTTHQQIVLSNISATMQLRFTGNIMSKSGDFWNIDNVVVSGPETGPAFTWLSIDSPISGTVIPTGSTTINMTCDATGLAEATYTADITIASNDPDEPSEVIAVSFIVAAGSVTPAIPANIVTNISGSNLIIDWDVSADATGYDVYSSDDPYGTFTFVTSVGTNQYTVAADQAKLFYYIVAKN